MHDGRFPVELVSGVPVVAAPAEIDISNTPELRAALLAAAAAADGAGALVADMSQTRFCDSSGVHTLMAAHKRAQAEGGELLLVVSSAAILRMFAITGIDRVIPNFTSLDDALAHASPDGSDGGAARVIAPPFGELKGTRVRVTVPPRKSQRSRELPLFWRVRSVWALARRVPGSA